MSNELKTEKKGQVISLLREQNSIRSIERITENEVERIAKFLRPQPKKKSNYVTTFSFVDL